MAATATATNAPKGGSGKVKDETVQRKAPRAEPRPPPAPDAAEAADAERHVSLFGLVRSKAGSGARGMAAGISVVGLTLAESTRNGGIAQAHVLGDAYGKKLVQNVADLGLDFATTVSKEVVYTARDGVFWAINKVRRRKAEPPPPIELEPFKGAGYQHSEQDISGSDLHRTRTLLREHGFELVRNGEGKLIVSPSAPSLSMARALATCDVAKTPEAKLPKEVESLIYTFLSTRNDLRDVIAEVSQKPAESAFDKQLLNVLDCALLSKLDVKDVVFNDFMQLKHVSGVPLAISDNGKVGWANGPPKAGQLKKLLADVSPDDVKSKSVTALLKEAGWPAEAPAKPAKDKEAGKKSKKP